MSRLLVSAVALSFFAGIPSAESFVARTYNNNSLTYFSWDPSTSVGQSGFFYTFIRLSEGLDFSIPQDYGDPSIIQKTAAAALPAHKDTKRARQLPDIVVVQNEAFYDVRQHELQVAPEAYAKYDITAAQAAVSGNVVVPTVGGNTVKTEFSFLSGIETTILPSACEYPYRSLVRKNIWSIAWYLKSLGYTTVAIHPYHRTFWDRNIAYPFLGFDEFIDHTQFSRNMREGLFVSDRAVADKIREVTKRTSGPLFVFAVTMENHGPWDRARVANQRSIEINSKLDAQDRTQMERYLHHVANAGNMASMLAGQLGKSVRPSLFAFYGDHAPALTAVENIPFRKGGSIMQTPYFIWKNFGKREHVTRDTSVSFLASEILDQAGVNDDPYFRANSYMDEANGNSFTSKTDDVSRSYIQLLYNNLLGKLPAASFKTAKDTAGGKPQL